MIETRNIQKTFGSYRALDDVSITVRQGSVFGLLGPNGAGKSTLIRIINRIIAADGGSVLFDGRPITDDDVLQIGYLPEERGLYKKMTVGDQAIYLARLKGLSRSVAEERLHQWFDRFDINSWWNRRVQELSKGMQQKVQFITTVLHEPKLLIFDEPFSGFDPVNATLLKNEILRLRDNGATVIFSTHNMSSVEEICDDIALINHSQVVLSGNVHDIRQSYHQNRYHVEGHSLVTPTLYLNDLFKVSNFEQNGKGFTADIQIPPQATANDLLQQLLPLCQITSLQAVLPTMNDIFIQTVKQ